MKNNLYIKTLAIVYGLIISSVPTLAQWTTDEENPQLVSTEENNRSDVASQPDGDGGIYVFWKDSRIESSHNDVYGQHYNSDGVALWEENGRAILDYTNSIWKYTTFLNETNGELFIASFTSGSLTGDSLRVRKLNVDGSAVWSEDLTLAQTDGCSPPTYILNMQNLQMTVSNDNYALVYESTLCGGYTNLFLSVFSSDGDLLTPYYGEQIVGAPGWSLQPTFDQSGDIFLSYTLFDNGYEAQLTRIAMDGTEVFPGVNMTSGPTDLNYMYRILSDENGVTFAWVTGGNIYARRFDNLGNQLWDDTTLNICIAEGTQDAFYMLLNGNELSMVWRDGRPGIVGNAAIYAQRFNLEGEILWPTDGIEVADLNTYVPYPKFAFNNNGDMIVCHTSNMTGMTAHKVLNDGSVQWGPNGIVQCITVFNQSNDDFNIIQSGENVIMAWQKSILESEIFISRVYPQITETYQDVVACESFTFNGETYDETGIYLVELPGDTLLSLDLTIINVEATVTVDGGTLTDTYVEGNSTWWNCDTNTIVSMGSDSFTPTVTGNYALIIDHEGCIDTSDCYFINVIGVEEWNRDFRIVLFPNPAQETLQIQSDIPLKNVSIDLFDTQGKLIFSMQNQTFQRCNLDIQTIANGMYNVVVWNGIRYYAQPFIKN